VLIVGESHVAPSCEDVEDGVEPCTVSSKAKNLPVIITDWTQKEHCRLLLELEPFSRIHPSSGETNLDRFHHMFRTNRKNVHYWDNRRHFWPDKEHLDFVLDWSSKYPEIKADAATLLHTILFKPMWNPMSSFNVYFDTIIAKEKAKIHDQKDADDWEEMIEKCRTIGMKISNFRAISIILQNPMDDCVVWCGARHVEYMRDNLKSIGFRYKKIANQAANLYTPHTVDTNCILPQDMLKTT